MGVFIKKRQICSFQYQHNVWVDDENQPVEASITTNEKQWYFAKHVSSELSLKHFCLVHYDLCGFARDLFGCPKPSTWCVVWICIYFNWLILRHSWPLLHYSDKRAQWVPPWGLHWSLLTLSALAGTETRRSSCNPKAKTHLVPIRALCGDGRTRTDNDLILKCRRV